MFTVFGATGHTGSVVVERLLAAGKQVRVIVRSADKAPQAPSRSSAMSPIRSWSTGRSRAPKARTS